MKWDDRGWGFVEIEKPRSDYFYEYLEKASTPMSVRLTEQRVALVRSYVPDEDTIVDVGIGSGTFIHHRKNTQGSDVDPKALAWLHETRLLASQPTYVAATFWDSLEHLRDPREWLDRITRFVFISIPVFRDAWHARHSKHYKPEEHFWYFTPEGLLGYMHEAGFEYLSFSMAETLRGREDIGTFVFARMDVAGKMWQLSR